MRTSEIALGVIAVACVAFVLLGRDGPEGSARDLDGRMDGLEQRLADVDARLATLKPSAPDPAARSTRNDVVERMGALEESVDRLVHLLELERERRPVAPPTPAAPVADPAKPDEVQRWIDELKSGNEDDVFKSTLELARLGSPKAVPPLIALLKTHKDFYGRLGAATALGELGAPDAVAGLIDALYDKEELVRTAAAESLRRITGQDFGFVSSLTKDEIAKIQAKWRTWWGENEERVRAK